MNSAIACGRLGTSPSAKFKKPHPTCPQHRRATVHLVSLNPWCHQMLLPHRRRTACKAGEISGSDDFANGQRFREESLQATSQENSAVAAISSSNSPEGEVVEVKSQKQQSQSRSSSTPSETEALQPTPAQGQGGSEDPSIEAIEAALKSFYRGAMEIFKLAFLLPFRYLIIAPLSWILTRLGFLAVNPTEVLRRLEAANEASPVSAPQIASVLRTLNRHHPKAVVDFVESNNVLHIPEESAAARSKEPTSVVDGDHGDASEKTRPVLGDDNVKIATQRPMQRYAVDAEVVREYLVALVKSDRIKEYTGTDMDTEKKRIDARWEERDQNTADMQAPSILPLRDGQSHRSLHRLFSELQAAAGGNPLPSAPGETTAWPLHVVLHGNGGGAVRGRPTGFLATLQSWFWFFTTCMLLGFTWAVGAAAVRRYSGGAGASGVAGPLGGGSPGHGVVAGPPGHGMFSTKEYAKENIPEKSVKKFSDVKGVDEAVTELQEIVEYLKKPDKFTRLGGKLPKGVLLTGPPGTGKTLLARAVAGEAGVPFFYKAGSEFDEMFVGVGSRRVRSMFAAAKKKAPCIVFIDEIDAVGGKRTSWDGSGGSRKTLNQLLTEMDGFEENSGVVVMAATNLPELLDSALTRPGRFDRQVAVALPDVRGRQQILDLYLHNKPVAADVDSQLLARRTPGFSGAQLCNLINEGALLAARHDADEITAALLDEARDKVLMGSPRSLVQSEEARTLTAYHEGGHALVALYTPGAKPIHKATIVPRGHALGMVSQVPDKDEYSTTRQQMVAHIDVCMGGKAAEELIFGADHVTSGATSDLKTATRLAKHMVEDCGMSDRIGPVALDEDSAAQGQDIRRVADAEVGSLLKSAYERVAGLLKGKEKELHTLAGALLERETLTQREIKELLWGADAVAAEEEAAANADVAVLEGAAAEVASEVPSTAASKGGDKGEHADVAVPVRTSRRARSS